jgi:hypothetical protein
LETIKFFDETQVLLVRLVLATPRAADAPAGSNADPHAHIGP